MMKTISLMRTLSLALLAGCSAVPESGKRMDDIARVEQMGDANKLYIVDCLLPGQIRRLGSKMTFLTARRPIKTSALDCEIRGGEYVAYDRANSATSLNIWLPKAQAGDPEAQTYTGEIYEKGLGTQPDYKMAADWYRKASAQGNSRAQVNLGNLYEKGLGVEKNLSTAMEWYRKASGLEKKGLPYAAPIATSSDNELVAEVQLLKHELDNSRNQSKALAEQLANTQQQLKETLEKQQRFQNERDQTKSSLENAQTKGNATESIRLEKILHEKDNELAVLKQQVSELNSQYRLKVNNLTLNLEETEKRAKQISDQLKTQQTATSDMQLKLVNAEAKLAGTEKKLLEAQKIYSKVDADRFSQTSHVNTSQDIQRKLEQSQALISQLQGEKQKLQQEIDNIHSISARSIPHPSGEGDSSIDSIFVNIDFGKYYALIIGNQKYEKIQSLDTPIADVRDVDQVLREKYNFNTTLLIDANRYQILTALNKLREKLTENDNLLIYYAGHGVLDKVNKRGHWLPVDAELNSDANWISTVSITDILNAMSSKHILVVSDSCYSAALTRAAIPRLDAGMSQEKKTEWVKTLLKTKSRTALTSGGLKPVLDGGGDGNHSVFANAFIMELRNNNNFMEGQELYRNVSEDVVVATKRIGGSEQVQVPEYAPIDHAGHEGGEFFFRPK